MTRGLISERNEADMSTYLANYKDTQVCKDSTANQLKDLKLTLIEAKRWTRKKTVLGQWCCYSDTKIKDK